MTTGTGITATNMPIGATLAELESWPGFAAKQDLFPHQTKTVSGTWFPGKV